MLGIRDNKARRDMLENRALVAIMRTFGLTDLAENVSFDTPHGRRVFNLFQPDRKIAFILKPNRVKLDQVTKDQIEKDAYLIAESDAVEQIFWVLADGASRPTRVSLDKAGIHSRDIASPDDPEGGEALETELDWLEAELQDTLDEDLEIEFSEPMLSREIRKIYEQAHPDQLDRRVYFTNLLRLQAELIKLQDWVTATGAKVLIIMEGRDSAGKGGVIKRITQRLNPRVARVVALPAPSRREQSQWYFQRYVPHLPAGGEIVLFDRSWYNRAGVERVMGFATENQVNQFFEDVPEFERMLVRSGVILLKYWFSITDEEQQLRFLMRIHDPMKQWKLSPMDLQSRIKWENYTRAKEDMFARTNIPEAPWFIVEGNDKKRERLNCIEHILSRIPYEEVYTEKVTLPERVYNPDYERQVLPDELYVPKIY